MPNKRTKVARERALEILESVEYKASLLRRVCNDSLAPLMERTLWEFAYGPPKQKVEVSTNRPDYSELTTEQLASKAEEIRRQLLDEAQEEERLAEESARGAALDALFAQSHNDKSTVQ